MNGYSGSRKAISVYVGRLWPISGAEFVIYKGAVRTITFHDIIDR